MPSATQTTPMMAQYSALKAEAGSALLLFRMGDFYELFLEDAAVAAAALDIALTSRGTHLGEPLPMCGVPVHSHEAYVARLVKAGHAVALAEQVEDPAEARKRPGKTVVKRAIVRIITPGTLMEERLLERGRANHLLAACPQGAEVGLAWADISAGDFHMATVPAELLQDEIARIAPAEILWPDDAPPPAGAVATPLVAAAFDARRGERLLIERHGVQGLDGFGRFEPPALAAAAGLLAHVRNTQRDTPIRLDPPRAHAADGRMAIDAATRRSLEIAESAGGGRRGSLIATIDRTLTGGGARLLSAELQAPLTDVGLLRARLDLVQWFIEPDIRAAQRALLKGMPDIQRLFGRIAANRAGPRDLGALRDALGAAERMHAGLAAAASAGAPAGLAHILARLDPPRALVERLRTLLAETLPPAASDGGAIAAGQDAALDELRLLARDSRSAILALEARLRERSGVQALKVRHNNVLGYHVEVASRNADPLMASAEFLHRQTLAGAMRFDTAELRDLATRIAQAEAQALAAEAAHLEELRAAILAEGDAVRGVAEALAAIDRSAALAEVAAEGGWVRPDVTPGMDFHIVAGRHPVVEAALSGGQQSFVPNDCRLEGDSRVWLVSGPNMGGKSTFLRQNALIAILAQAGSFVPALEARIGIVDRLYSRVGAADSLAEGRSTFMVEMVETAAILNGATNRSLLLLDEVGRGTATWDGLALAWAILEAVHDRIGARTLFATHYHELANLKGRLKGLALRTMRVREWKGDLILLHEVAEGAAPGSFGIEVARLAGVPGDVLKRAREILRRLETGDAGKGAREALSALPLFGAADSAPDVPDDPLRARLNRIRADELTPRAALDLVYELIALTEKEG